MNIKKYFLSKAPYLIINLIIYLLIAVILKIADMPNIVLFLILCIWFMPLVIYIILIYCKEKKFYGQIKGITDKLDKKYLLPEIIKRPNYYEGQIFYDSLKECNRNMHEEVNFHKHLQREYREYIETWVHEIKTPIASSKLILENSHIKEKIELISEVDKIEQYIIQALYYSRSTDISKDYIIREFNIQDIVNTCVRENRRSFINNKIMINIQNVDVKVISDAKWVKFIINQIIINAIKYRKKDNPKIEIYTLRRQKDECFNNKENLKQSDNNIVKLIIEDNGIGVPKSDINRVFDKGFTGENGRVYGKSTGIGLYLCKKLCDKLDLEIELKSQFGYGSKIIITFMNT